MPTHRTRISIIGCGHVGTSCAYAILHNRLARDIVLIGDTEAHVQGEALDLQQAVPLGAPITIFAGTYKDAAGSAIVIGEHGDSSVAVWSAAQVAGLPLTHYPGADTLPTHEELLIAVRYAGPVVATLKGNTCFAIASCVTRICEAILRDERSVLIVSTLLIGQYGLRDVALSTPCIVGCGGVESVIELHLNKAEQKALEASAAVLQQAYAKLDAPKTQ
jgi:malate/lactate dehydrogenase